MQAIIHEMSTSVPLPKFDVFGVPPTQNTIVRDIMTEHRPLTALDPSTFIQFEVTTAIDEYIDLEKIYLFMKVQVKKFDDKDINEVTDLFTTNYLLHSMIKQMDIFIGDTQINPSTPTYAYKAYFEALLGFGLNAKRSHLSSAGWIANQDRKKADQRNTKLQNLGPYDLYGRIHADIAFQGKSLLGGVKLTIRILLHEPAFYMITNKYKNQLDFLESCLIVHRSKVPQYIVDAHNAALRISPAKYPLTLVKVKPFTIPKGTVDINIDNVHNGQLPRRIFIAFVYNTAFLGDYSLDPLDFNHFNISMLSVFVNGEQFPSKPFTPDFKNKLYIREMISVYDSLDMMDYQSTVDIDRYNYSEGYTIFGFNFAPDLTSGAGAAGHLSHIKYGTLGMNLRFAEEIGDAITALVYCEFDKILEIDINRNVNIDLF